LRFVLNSLVSSRFVVVWLIHVIARKPVTWSWTRERGQEKHFFSLADLNLPPRSAELFKEEGKSVTRKQTPHRVWSALLEMADISGTVIDVHAGLRLCYCCCCDVSFFCCS
jgi:hypothetical protein